MNKNKGKTSQVRLWGCCRIVGKLFKTWKTAHAIFYISRVTGDGEAHHPCAGDPAGELQRWSHDTCSEGAAGGLHPLHTAQQEGTVMSSDTDSLNVLQEVYSDMQLSAATCFIKHTVMHHGSK